jgi:2-polyprenyl-6-methoxyphenol hydroxylase and related FAD-dependent oxidoreductases
MNKKKITIIGAGLVGSLLAILLRKRGYQVSVLERRPDMRKTVISAGRSINLAMSVRGWAGLEAASLRSAIEELAIPMYGRQIHHKDRTTVFQPYGKNNEAIYSVSRSELNKKLISLAEEEGAALYFEQRVSDIDIEKNIIHVVSNDSTTSYTEHECIIAADGAFSALRNAYLKTDRYNYQQFYIEHGYKELEIKANKDGQFQLEKNALHIWPRKNYMLIALPNLDGSFTCTLFFPFEGNPSFKSISTPEAFHTFFKEEFPDAYDLMPDAEEQFFQNPTASLVTVKCFPWHYKDKNMLIGDAAHAIVPFYGQGMNAGFEDCRVFMELHDQGFNDDWELLFKKYQQARKINGDAVADLALQNFIEMRDFVADSEFLIRKQIEKEIGRQFPELFNSVYEMVSFTHTPYAEAIRSQKAQDDLIANIMTHENPLQWIADNSNQAQLLQYLSKYNSQINEVKQELATHFATL